jgi:hypothetical protein
MHLRFLKPGVSQATFVLANQGRAIHYRDRFTPYFVFQCLQLWTFKEIHKYPLRYLIITAVLCNPRLFLNLKGQVVYLQLGK